MDARRFDRLAKTFSADKTRRGFIHLLAALPLVGALVVLLDDEGVGRRRKARNRVNQENHKHEGRRRKHGNHHKKQKNRCQAEPPAETCADRCGAVQNNCHKSVDCGSCECDEPCPACQICNTSNRQCEPDAALNGELCASCRTCADGACAAPCDGSGCCDAGTCVPGAADDACGTGGDDCVACGGNTPNCGAQSPGVCGVCIPTTCAAAGAECGSIADSCGGTVECDVCENPRPICTGNTCTTCAGAGQCLEAGSGDLCCAGQCVSGVCCAAADCLPAGDTCVGNQCRCGGAATCAGDAPDCCDGACTNTNTDPENCDACGNTCSGATPVCWDGACVCGDVCPSGCQFSSVPAAIAAAPSGATILICAGDYPTTADLLKDLTIRGAGAALTTLRGSATSRVFDTGSNRQLHIEGLTITGGHAANGGGIVNHSTMTLKGVIVTGNVAEGPGAGVGGGIFNFQGTLVLDNSQVTLNTAGNRGGGIATQEGTVTLTNGSTVTENQGGNCDPPGTIAGCVG